MSSANDDVDDFFAQMKREEQSKVKNVQNLFTAQEQRQKQRLQQIIESKQQDSAASNSSVQQSNAQAITMSPQELLQVLQRDIQALDPTAKREIRIGALQRIQTLLKQQPSQTLRVIFAPSFYQPLFKMFNDSVESCRETAAAIVLE